MVTNLRMHTHYIRTRRCVVGVHAETCGISAIVQCHYDSNHTMYGNARVYVQRREARTPFQNQIRRSNRQMGSGDLQVARNPATHSLSALEPRAARFHRVVQSRITMSVRAPQDGRPSQRRRNVECVGLRARRFAHRNHLALDRILLDLCSRTAQPKENRTGVVDGLHGVPSVPDVARHLLERDAPACTTSLFKRHAFAFVDAVDAHGRTPIVTWYAGLTPYTKINHM